jgi:hypothetical protein
MNSRTKGHGYEREVAKDYRELGLEAKRGLQGRGAEECDVVLEGLPLWIECQCSNKPTVFKKLEQAQRDTPKENSLDPFNEYNKEIVLHIKKSAAGRGSGKGPKQEVVVLEKDFWYWILEHTSLLEDLQR